MPDADTVTQKTVRTVRQRILSGQVAPGERLPSERGLAEDLGVSRLTLRAALARLETEGLVRAVPGSGNEVLNYREHGRIDLIGHLATQPTLPGVTQRPFGLLVDLLEVRRMFAVELIRLVTERASKSEIDALYTHLAHQRELLSQVHTSNADAFVEADLTFARTLVRTGKNLALELLYNTVVRIVEDHPGLRAAFVANPAQTIQVYERILSLIQDGDARRAARVSRRLLTHLDQKTIAVFQGGTADKKDQVKA